MAKVKSWTHGELGEPNYPDDYEIAKRAVLQVTDIKTNHNKYYSIELHTIPASSSSLGSSPFRIFTHYGRTDDLESNPMSGQKECRYFDAMGEAQAEYDRIYREKTSAKKGYKEVALASSKIGSPKARGQSAGTIDEKTLSKIQGEDGQPVKPKPAASALAQGVQDLVRYIYDEATAALTSTVAAKITANGIETPLGVLTIGQVEKGEKILAELYDQFQEQQNGPGNRVPELERLTGDFYTAIPHRIGRSRAAVANSVINSFEQFEQKQQILQLMKDMLQVNGEGGNVLFNAQIDSEYQALGCRIGHVDPKDPKYRELEQHVIKSQVKSKSVKIKNIYTLRRETEWGSFLETMDNARLLFHGSRIQNWVGILSRGILLPKIVVSMGVNRTDAGWLGNGIYFGDAACTSSFYTSPGKKKTRFMAIARVALGRMKEYHKITYGLNAPPPGYDSCHGVRRKMLVSSQFDDDEYVVYDLRQQRLEYLVEFTS